MPELTLRSPNYFDREIDVSTPTQQTPVGVPAGVIGTSLKGPAFVPINVGSYDEFVSYFGGLDSKKFAPYAVSEFLKHRSSLTFLRVLGAGANTTDAHISTTLSTGKVRNAGVYFEGVSAPHDGLGRHAGVVQFLAAKHTVQTNEAFGMPLFSDNSSFNGSVANLIRGMIMTTTSSRVMVLDGNESAVGGITTTTDDSATVSSGYFKIVISSSLGNTFANTDGNVGVKIFTASLNPTDSNYFAKILNTDPDRLIEDQHYLYADFAVDDELATATQVAVLSGSALTSNNSGDSTLVMRKAFGSLDTRYKAPQTTWFISQPFGNVEYDLFKFEALDDGEYANTLYKVSIVDVKASVDDTNKYGTFTVQIRDWNDTDVNSVVLETFPGCSLNPLAENYVAKVIGDRKVAFNFDATLTSERKIYTAGKYNNKSKYVRIVMSDNVEKSVIPETTLPFGFRGANVLKTNDALTDTAQSLARVVGKLGVSSHSALSGSIIPPVPYRFKVTRGDVSTTSTWPGAPGSTEIASSLYYWGVKFERNTSPLNPNVNSEKSSLLSSLSKFVGIEKLDTLVTGSGADTLCNNKFTLAKVALSNTSVTHLTSSVNDHMREAAYIRNATINPSNYTVNDGVLGNRLTLASVLTQGGANEFNRFSQYTKFTNFLAGGWDGLNPTDKYARRMNDRSTSFDAGGCATTSYISPGLASNVGGSGQSNGCVVSYVTAIDMMTDPMISNVNIIAIPGIRETFITDYAMKKAKEYGFAYYVMDIPSYDDSTNRLYDDSTAKPSVEKTRTQFEARVIDNDYAGTYYPNIFIDDEENNKRVEVPASIAAMGALAYNDRVSFPWFAPAGFNRASLDFVKNVKVRLSVAQRDALYDSSRINPIATFPRLGYVVFGQKTLKLKKSALDRVNVRRMLLEVKRLVVALARDMVFEQNVQPVIDTFVSNANLALGLIQVQQGIEEFRVIMDSSNNTQEDYDLNRVNGTIKVRPTKVAEFIAIDFIITNKGVQFVLNKQAYS